MQQLILETLDEAKDAIRYGNQCKGAAGEAGVSHFSRPGWVRHRNNVFVIPANVYDMRVSQIFLQMRAGHVLPRYDNVLQSSFGRAVKTLIRDDILTAPHLIPIEHLQKGESRNPSGIHYLANGIYAVAGRQKRFVMRGILDEGA